MFISNGLETHLICLPCKLSLKRQDKLLLFIYEHKDNETIGLHLIGRQSPCHCNIAVKNVSVVEVCIVLLDFSLTVKAAPHECVIRTIQP